MASFKNRRRTIKRRKGRRNNKSRKYMNRKKSIKTGGKILGTGKDGCVIDSINYGNYTNENGYVAKILNSVINYDLINRLKQIDPNEIRFVHYIMPDETFDTELLKQNEDYITCKNNLSGNLNIIFMKKLNPINTRELNKQQYRYLRESLQILHDNNISHGDLIDNVMVDLNNNPIIIDWENAKLNADYIDKKIDNDAFLSSGNFKVKRNV
jgi:serine/threonine protein kinase